MSQDDGNELIQEEEVQNIPGWAPSMTLDVKDSVETGEEGEEELYSQRAKLFRFREKEWKERGLGEAKLLKHKETGKIRFILRQESTLKVVANHFVISTQPYCELRVNEGNLKCWVWSAQDCAEEVPEVTQFALKLPSVEIAEKFRDAFNDAKAQNAKLGDFGEAGTKSNDVSEDNKDTSDVIKDALKATEDVKVAINIGSLFSTAGSTGDSAATGGPFSSGLFSAGTGGLFSSTASTGGLFSSTASTGGLFSSMASTGGLFSCTASSGGLFSSLGGSSGGLFSSGTDGAAAANPFFSPAPRTEETGKAAEKNDDEYVVEEEVVNIPGWTASVNLEVLDIVPTGEEDEEELYSQRSKLYRYRDGDWKERCLGEAKILKHKTTSKVRFMMREQKTGKIMANQYTVNVGCYCDLRPNAGSEKCWVWTAQDYSDDEPAVDQFALKFGSVELAQKFKESFDEAKRINSALGCFADLGEGGDDSAKPVTPNPADPPAPKPTPAEQPKAAATTTADPKAAAASSNPFAGMTLFGNTSGGAASSGGLFSSASSSSGGGLFSSSNTGAGLFSSSTSGGGLFSSSNTGAGLFSSSSSGSGLLSSTASSGGLFSSANTGAGLFSSGSTGSGLFSSAASTGGLSSSASSGGLFSSGNSSGGGGASLFSFGGGNEGGLFSAPAPAATAAPTSQEKTAAATGDDDKYVEDEEVVHIPGWAPTVNLEVLDKVDLGEEEEDELYKQRSKLYRFRDGDWKERGLGEAKLLQHKQTKKVRFMLRQEKTLKIVSNHYAVGVGCYCDLRPNMGSEKCWVWTAQDYADEQVATEQFALKFGSAELAQKFKEAFEDAKKTNATLDDFASLEGGGSAKPDKSPAPTPAASPVTAPAPAPAQKSPISAPAPAPAATPSLFGNSSASTGGLFSTGTSSASTGGLFGGAGSLFGTGGGLFSSSTSGMGGGLFSSAATASTGGLFSGGAAGGGLFSGIGATTAASAPEVTADNSKNSPDEEDLIIQEEVTNIPGFVASVNLQVLDKVDTGEEDEVELYAQRSKLYRFRDADWKERGLGEAKLLQHKQTKKVRFLLRQEKTSKIVANFWVLPYCDLRLNAGSEKCWVWTAQDNSDDDCVMEQFALKFGTVEHAQAYKVAFDNAKNINAKLACFKDVAGLGASGGATAGTTTWAAAATNGKAEEAEEEADDDDDEANEDEEEDYEIPAATGPPAGGGGLSALAAAMESKGWRCPGCRLQWPEETLECPVCEIPRPGYEDKVESKEEKGKGMANAAAAFLGTSASTTTQEATGFSFAAPSTQATGFSFAAPSTQTTSSPGLFAAPVSKSAPSAKNIFGGGAADASAPSTSIFGAPAASTPAPAAMAPMTFGTATTGVFGQPQPPPPPPAVSPTPAFGFGNQAQPSVAPTMFGTPSPILVPPKAALTPAPTAAAAPTPPAPVVVPTVMVPPAAAAAVAAFAAPPVVAPALEKAGGLDSSVMLEIVKAITAAQQGNVQHVSGGDGGRQQILNEEATRKSEEAIRKSEDAMRKTEDLLRRLQDEAEKTRSAEQQARRMEEQVEALRRQQQQSEANHRQMIDSVRDELRREREERSSMSVKHTAVVDMLQLRLESTQKVADEAMKAVEDKKVDRILERVELFGERVERRFDAWESMFEGRQGAGQRALPASSSIGSNIANYRNLHFQQTGRGIADKAEEIWTRKA